MRKRIKPVCEFCGKDDVTVSIRACGYHQEINNIVVYEVICDDCEYEHVADI